MRTIHVHVKENKLLIFTVLLLILNTLLLTLGVNYLRSQEEFLSDNLDEQKLFAEEIVEYNSQLAQQLEVNNRPRVIEALSRFYYDINLASGREELYKAILFNGRAVQETILREYEGQQQEIILSLVNQDPNISEVNSSTVITITYDFDTGILVEPEGLLEEETLDEIGSAAFLSDVSPRQIIELEVENGQAKPIATHNPLDHINILTNELNSLRSVLYETRVSAGFAEMSGEGIIVRLYDAEDGHTTEQIVHDSDILALVNEIYNAGAQGVAVGNQRIATTSHIRCVGSTIRVNDNPIPVNPVVVKAVGNPEVLASALDLIKASYEILYGLRMEVEKVDKLTLPAYSG